MKSGFVFRDKVRELLAAEVFVEFIKKQSHQHDQELSKVGYVRIHAKTEESRDQRDESNTAENSGAKRPEVKHENEPECLK